MLKVTPVHGRAADPYREHGAGRRMRFSPIPPVLSITTAKHHLHPAAGAAGAAAHEEQHEEERGQEGVQAVGGGDETGGGDHRDDHEQVQALLQPGVGYAHHHAGASPRAAHPAGRCGTPRWPRAFSGALHQVVVQVKLTRPGTHEQGDDVLHPGPEGGRAGIAGAEPPVARVVKLGRGRRTGPGPAASGPRSPRRSAARTRPTGAWRSP